MNLKARVGQRSDAWDEAADTVLAETVLKAIRGGATQLAAFNEAGDKLGRTPAACGFRWNGVLRKVYREQIELAKQERKAFQRPTPVKKAETVTSTGAMREVISFLETFDAQYQRLQRVNEELLRERDQLRARLKAFESSSPTEQPTSAITREQLDSDARTLIEIMSRARQLVKE